MKIYLNKFFNDLDLTPFLKMFSTVFNEDIEFGTIENSDILFESVFGNTSLLYNKKWLYSFLFIGESDRRLALFMNNGLQNERLKDYSCVLKGKSENDNVTTNVVNFPLFILYSYSFIFTHQFKKDYYDEKRFNSIAANKIINIIPNKNICVIISNGNDSEGRNYFLDQLDQKVKVDYAGGYKNNVERINDFHCSPGFIDFISKYKIIITMENSKNDNYITEKILQGFAANIIPVYWGANNILDYFNEERFINVKSFDIKDINEAIDKIMMILNNDDKYIEIINKPIYTNNFIPLTLTDVSLDIKKILNIEKSQFKKFITFGGPTSDYHDSVKRICAEAESLCFFDKIKGFTELNLKNDEIFWEKHGNFIQNNPRGYGYWLWKSYLIKKELEKINQNDILIYCDSGCQININGKKRLLEYIDMLNTNKENYGIISFQLEFKAIQYTKNEVFECFHLDENSKNMLQCMATVVIIKKNTHSINIINEWYNTCENYHLINDNIKNESSYFIDNRHDQSILSILVNKYNSIKLLDETYFYPNWETDGSNYPFWAKRIK
jgi:hypothetical protein